MSLSRNKVGHDSTCLTQSSEEDSDSFDINDNHMTSSMFLRGNIRIGKEVGQKLIQNRILTQAPQQQQTSEATTSASNTESSGLSLASSFDTNDSGITSSMFHRVNARIGKQKKSQFDWNHLQRQQRDRKGSLEPGSSTINSSISTECSSTFDINRTHATSSMFRRVNERIGRDRPCLPRPNRTNVSKKGESSESTSSTSKDSGIRDIHRTSGDFDGVNKIRGSSKRTIPIPNSSIQVTDAGTEQRDELVPNVETTASGIAAVALNVNDDIPDIANSTTGQELSPDLLQKTIENTFFNYESGSVSSALKKCGIKLPPYPARGSKTIEQDRKTSDLETATPNLFQADCSEVPSEILLSSESNPVKHSQLDGDDRLSTCSKIFSSLSSISASVLQSFDINTDVTIPELSIIELDITENSNEPDTPLQVESPGENLNVTSNLEAETSESSHQHASQIEADEDNEEDKASTPIVGQRRSKRLSRKVSYYRSKTEDLRSNKTLISKQLLLQTLREFDMKLDGNLVETLHSYLNLQLENMLNRLCSINAGCEGVFTYRQLETALKKRTLVNRELGKCSLLITIAHILSPSQYQGAKGLLIPSEGKYDTKLRQFFE